MALATRVFVGPKSGYHCYLGLARIIYILCIYGIFGREITKYTVIYGVYIRFWPTLLLPFIHTPETHGHTFTWHRSHACLLALNLSTTVTIHSYP